MNEINVGGVPEHFNLPWHQAIESDKFSGAYRVKYRNYAGGTGALMKAMREKLLDVAIVLTQGAVADILKGNPSKVVKVYVESPLIWGIHVPATSSLKSTDDIQGKTYAVSRMGSGSHLMSIVDASERGWDSDNLKFEVVGNLEGARAAFKHKNAEVFLWERFTTQPYVEAEEFRRVGIRESGWPAFVVCVRDEVMEQQGDNVKSMLEIINHQCETLMQDSNAVSEISKRYELRPDETAEWFSKTRWSTDFSEPKAALEKVISYLNRLKIVDCPTAQPSDVWKQIG